MSARTLAVWAVKLELGASVRLGRGEELAGGRARESVLASALEAVVAALYLEGGLPPVRRLVSQLIA